MFTSGMGGPPKYGIGDGSRSYEVADLDVVMAISHELAERSIKDKELIAAMIEMDLGEVTLGQLVLTHEPDEEGEDFEEVAEALFSTQLVSGKATGAQ